MKGILILAVPPLMVAMLVCIYLIAQSPLKTSTGYATSYAEPLLSQVIERERKANKLPKGLIEAVISHESKFREDAYNPEPQSQCAKSGRKDCGSMGLMQVVPRWHGACPDGDFACNIRKGARHLGGCFRDSGTVWGAAKCYNGAGRAAEIYANKVVKEYAIWKRLS